MHLSYLVAILIVGIVWGGASYKMQINHTELNKWSVHVNHGKINIALRTLCTQSYTGWKSTLNTCDLQPPVFAQQKTITVSPHGTLELLSGDLDAVHCFLMTLKNVVCVPSFTSALHVTTCRKLFKDSACSTRKTDRYIPMSRGWRKWETELANERSKYCPVHLEIYLQVTTVFLFCFFLLKSW